MKCIAFAPFVLLLVSLGLHGPCVALAESEHAVGPTPPRLASIEGDASFWRPGADDWAPAHVNTPLAAGDDLYAGKRGNLEVEIGPHAFVRAGPGTEVGLESLETGFVQFKVPSGQAAFDLQRMPEGQRVEVDTPSGAFTIDRAGYYRSNVDDHGTTFISRRGGDAAAIPAGGEASDVPDGQQVVLQGTDTATANASPAPAPDAWDRWNDERDGEHPEHVSSAEYVPPNVAGADDLDRYGDWRETPRYGHVWVPRETPAGWAPYSNGNWTWDPSYHWTWVDDAPWGWAPYHYGRWVDLEGTWGWAPGPVVAPAVYAPALVGFVGPVGVSVNVGIGIPVPALGWVALGFGEPVLPWWGPVGFIGRPFWGGWYGPHIVNNVVINNTRIVNVTTINRFQNMNVHNAVVGVPRDQFGRGRVRLARLGPNDLQKLQPVHGQLGIKPVAASLVPNSGRASRPPEGTDKRPMIATRVPQDPARRLQAAGLPAPKEAASTPEARIVQPQHMARAGAAGGRRRFGSEPPPPPGSPRERSTTMGPEQHAAAGGPGGEGPHTDRGPAAPASPAGGGPSGAASAGAEHHAQLEGANPQHPSPRPVEPHPQARRRSGGHRAASPSRAPTGRHGGGHHREAWGQSRSGRSASAPRPSRSAAGSARSGHGQHHHG